ncbi:hypothetical protein BDW42DRAFT_197411 [Aspergillus taichungensis]|uniref:DUF7580 domain-containing protein n=1 Tax=Aspergillus taichungensis TaxID=482145 RepID=A0A2J5HGG6_9EURO|nr:hypothetical protein BDW42DRAFT_197411 [Aspergillus taichungensis]
MVTGIETTGVVLAILPLLVNQVDNYVQGLETLKSFRAKRYLADLHTYLENIENQRVLFVNTLEQALDGIVDYPHEIGELINDPGGSLWTSPSIQSGLEQKMGRSYEPFQRKMAELSHLLTLLTEKLELDHQQPQEYWDNASVVEREVKKFRHIFKKSVYTQLLNRIKEVNSLLRTLVQQTDELHFIRKRRLGLNQRLVWQKKSREAARSLYNIIIYGQCGACPCKDEHHIRFVLEPLPPKQVSLAGIPGNPRFRMVFSSKANGGVERAWTDGHEIEAESASNQHSLAISRLNMLLAQGGQSSTGARRVRSPSNTIQNICSTLSAVTISNEAKLPLGRLSDAQHQHSMYYVRCTTGRETWQSLEDLLAKGTTTTIPSVQPNSACGATFSRKSRSQLALNLACSVLQFHGTWLKANWRPSDILLPGEEGTTNFHSPYLLPSVETLKERTICNQQNSNSNSSILIQNEALFPLGLALVELSLCQNLDALYAPEDHDLIKAEAYLKTALRVMETVETESGRDYADVVRQCLLWHGRKQDSLEDEKLQERIFQLIILPLMEYSKIFEG